jgi:hypothetical protein
MANNPTGTRLITQVFRNKKSGIYGCSYKLHKTTENISGHIRLGSAWRSQFHL